MPGVAKVRIPCEFGVGIAASLYRDNYEKGQFFVLGGALGPTWSTGFGAKRVSIS